MNTTRRAALRAKYLRAEGGRPAHLADLSAGLSAIAAALALPLPGERRVRQVDTVCPPAAQYRPAVRPTPTGATLRGTLAFLGVPGRGFVLLPAGDGPDPLTVAVTPEFAPGAFGYQDDRVPVLLDDREVEPAGGQVVVHFMKHALRFSYAPSTWPAKDLAHAVRAGRRTLYADPVYEVLESVPGRGRVVIYKAYLTAINLVSRGAKFGSILTAR